jgi:aryl carrier-like protein
LFEWLVTKQPPQYHAHEDLLKAGVDSIEKAIILLELLRKNGIQGFKATLALLSSPCYKSSAGSIINIMEGFEEWISVGNSANTFIDDFLSTKFTPIFNTI